MQVNEFFCTRCNLREKSSQRRRKAAIPDLHPTQPPQHLGYGGFCAVPSPYMRNTRAAAPSDFTAKSEGAATVVGRWYGGGGGEGKGRAGGRRGGKVCAWGREGSGRIWITTRRLGSRRGAPRRYKDRGAPVVCAYNGTWAGESSRCEDPAPTAGMAGRSLRVCRTDYHLRPRGHQRERRMRRLRRGTLRRYALRETGE